MIYILLTQIDLFFFKLESTVNRYKIYTVKDILLCIYCYRMSPLASTVVMTLSTFLSPSQN